MLQEIINERWKELFKAKDTIGKSAFESVKAKILVAEKSGNYSLPISDDVVETIIIKEVKELQETRSFYKETDEQYAQLDYKIKLLSEYLPKQLSEVEVIQIIKEFEATEPNTGKLIGRVVKEVGARFDKSRIAALVNRVKNN